MAAGAPMLSPRIAVVVTFDAWPLHSLGCYGNEWVDTPTWDELAATGFVFDRHVANHVTSAEDAPAAISGGWLKTLRQQGIRVVHLHEPDARSLPDLPVEIETVMISEGHNPPRSPQDLPFSHLVSAAREFLKGPTTTPTVLWLHSAGISDDSVPPEEMWEHYVDEFAAEDFDWEHGDPAEIARHPAIRAVSVTMLDFLLGELWTSLKSRPEPVLLSCSGLAGSPWLPVQRRTPIAAGLDAASQQTPWVLWEQNLSQVSPSTRWTPGRSTALVQPSDLGPTIAEWCGGRNTEIAGVWPHVRGETDQRQAWVVTRTDGPALCIWTELDQVIFPDGVTLNPTDFTGIQRFWQPEDPWNVFDTAATEGARIREVMLLVHSQIAPASADV